MILYSLILLVLGGYLGVGLMVALMNPDMTLITRVLCPVTWGPMLIVEWFQMRARDREYAAYLERKRRDRYEP